MSRLRTLLRRIHDGRYEPDGVEIGRELRRYANLVHELNDDVPGSIAWEHRDAVVWTSYFNTVQRQGPREAWELLQLALSLLTEES